MATEQSVMAVIRASRPAFRNPHDKVAFSVHASFLAAGYVLNAVGPSASTDDALTSSSSDEVGVDQWNEFEDNYAFVYSNPGKGSKKVLVKCLAMNDKLLLDALADGSSEPVHLEINVGDYAGEDGGTNYALQFKNLGKLVDSVNKEVLTKLSGSSATSSSGKPSSSERERLRDYRKPSSVDVSEPEGHLPYPSGYVVPPLYPSGGGSDLFPGPPAGFYPTRGDYGGGGMLVGPQDPRFFGGMGGDPGFPAGQPGVPPGARFDPYGPPGVPGFEPGRFARDPRRPRGGNHPDLEHFGSGSDFI
ncbi:hypothetical protein RJ640_014324 [Escallonia rubra]|uniref:Proteasome inhibitor PI31 subunit n=1 Tax=Escallonia rubra TaxID=112253 RepID=A0AA88R3S7_9ASTE|nr:hypothetical protein RJ640_014324 [Escallonia rubra]